MTLFIQQGNRGGTSCKMKTLLPVQERAIKTLSPEKRGGANYYCKLCIPTRFVYDGRHAEMYV